ncbi:hypothetical protein BJV78DRAFT_1224805 [Lactifluus subvellereus]|nr:hypothetical protein BJV78DRAFT_1224805 [Lactifluus subvellereus]
MNVLIYTSAPSGLSNALRSVLSPFYTVQSITSGSLATQPWTTSCALLVLPSPGPLSLPKPAHEAIQEYITAGGRMFGIGLGVSFLPHSPARNRFDLWDARSGTAIVPEAPRGVSESTRSSSLPSIRLQTGALLSGLWPADVPFELTRATSEVIIHGHWEDPPGAGVGTAAAAVAGVQVPVGSGRAAFWGVSLDDDVIEDHDGFASPSVLALLRYALTSLGLTVPAAAESSSSGSPSSPSPLRVLPPATPQYPLPQFLLHSRGKRHIAETVLEKLGLSTTDSASSGGEPGVLVLKDATDTFHFHRATIDDGARLVAEARETAAASQHMPRVVVVLPPDELPPRELMPRFDVEKYFAVLEGVRGNQEASAAADSSWGLGEALFYGEAVTSTQTMLERNPRLLTSLPAPIVSLATFQLAGRGRGSNAWLSPEGCLQFSVLVRAPLSALPAARLVFVQYLVGLAVIHACRHRRVLGSGDGDRGARVKLKWPNDVYVELPGGEKKVGGILVNTSFSGGNVDIVVGCGIDVCTPSPVTALSALCPPGQQLDIETVLALILTEFERLWTTFVRGRGSWAPFEEAYLDAWMHSDQLVTLTTVDPPIPVRIIGITHDHGLLRTIPERTGWSRSWRHGTDEYVDLRPDGNSFDIMTGLIKAKK